MMVLVSYDVSTRDDAGRRRLRRVARLCEDHGQRVQNSVFECVVDSAQWVVLRASLVSEADPAQDSLRFYFLGTEWRDVSNTSARSSPTILKHLSSFSPSQSEPKSFARTLSEHRFSVNIRRSAKCLDVKEILLGS